MLGDVPNISNAFTRIEIEFLICNRIRNINTSDPLQVSVAHHLEHPRLPHPQGAQFLA